MGQHKFEDMAVRAHAMGLHAAAESLGELSQEQVAKLEQISDIVEELPPVTIDNELDAVLEALTEIRDRP